MLSHVPIGKTGFLKPDEVKDEAPVDGEGGFTMQGGGKLMFMDRIKT